jgi:hypothetical protein
MPTPPNFKANPLSPEYLWNEKALQYINRSTGRFVPRSEITEQLFKVTKQSSERMRAISQQLRDGNVSLADWQLQMMQEIKTTHLAGAAMQKGGWQQMTQADFGRVGQIVRREYGFLRDLANGIESGKIKLDGRILIRAAQYGQAGRETQLLFWNQKAADRGYDQERSVLNPAEHCNECVDEAAKGWQALGEMIPIGRRTCRANDRCDKWYRNSATGEVLKV